METGTSEQDFKIILVTFTDVETKRVECIVWQKDKTGVSDNLQGPTSILPEQQRQNKVLAPLRADTS